MARETSQVWRETTITFCNKHFGWLMTPRVNSNKLSPQRNSVSTNTNLVISMHLLSYDHKHISIYLYIQVFQVMNIYLYAYITIVTFRSALTV